MKKVVVLMFVLGMVSACAYAAETPAAGITPAPAQSVQKINPELKRRNAAFEKRLGLTEAQKAQAREIRLRGHEKLKPVLEELNNKKQEAKMVKLSRIAVWAQEEKLAALDKEISKLEKKANQIRKANMKEFESILTRDQKKILKQMKKEGRQRYEKRKAELQSLNSKQLKK